MIGNGPAAYVHFWGGRDGFSSWGWWVGPNIGGEDVLAYNPTCSSTNKNPPCTGWQVPPGLPDEEFFVQKLPAPLQSAVLGWEKKKHCAQGWQNPRLLEAHIGRKPPLAKEAQN